MEARVKGEDHASKSFKEKDGSILGSSEFVMVTSHREVSIYVAL